ncbi:hypothetical protein ACFVYD_01440 [Streptomyces sp. NPDC058301]|uniref:hypothetical protein n=1 Tax=Streptomyces sp. NPDC058301 TaxID=3346436 RepID=UPI0036EE1105
MLQAEGEGAQPGCAAPPNGPFEPGGLDIDAQGRPITAAGEPLRTAWAVGYLVEGPRLYTHALPRQGMASQFTLDADASVRGMVTHIHHRYDTSQDQENEHARAQRKSASLPGIP